MVNIYIVDELSLTRLGLHCLISKIDDVEVVGQTSNYCEALLLVEKIKPDIVIINKSTPGLRMLEFIKNILTVEKVPRTLVISAYDDNVWLQKVENSGICGYLLRDHGVDDLKDAIETVMSGEFFFPSSSSRHLSNETISSRECEILSLIADGHTSKEAGSILNISHRTVEHHRANLMEKLRVNDLQGLTKYAVRCGITDPSVR